MEDAGRGPQHRSSVQLGRRHAVSAVVRQLQQPNLAVMMTDLRTGGRCLWTKVLGWPVVNPREVAGWRRGPPGMQNVTQRQWALVPGWLWKPVAGQGEGLTEPSLAPQERGPTKLQPHPTTTTNLSATTISKSSREEVEQRGVEEACLSTGQPTNPTTRSGSRPVTH